MIFPNTLIVCSVFTVLCPDCILFVDEFSVSKAPSTNGRKFYISSPRLAEENLRTRDRLKKLMRGLVVGENIPRYYRFFLVYLAFRPDLFFE